nr:unnamed protein product [Digitaria exilis]
MEASAEQLNSQHQAYGKGSTAKLGQQRDSTDYHIGTRPCLAGREQISSSSISVERTRVDLGVVDLCGVDAPQWLRDGEDKEGAREESRG